jgi:hypothetical protein
VVGATKELKKPDKQQKSEVDRIKLRLTVDSGASKMLSNFPKVLFLFALLTAVACGEVSAQSEKKVLTEEIAEQFLANEYSVRLDEFETIEDAAAEALSKHEGEFLFLSGLTSLSDSAA